MNRLRALKTEREAYVGPWLPEPMMRDTPPPPDRHLELASDLSVAFLVLLERLGPDERAAFLLHEVFDFDYGAIATRRCSPCLLQMRHGQPMAAAAPGPRSVQSLAQSRLPRSCSACARAC